MSFSESSGIITQANESSKVITSVASATGGIQVAVTAHGYSDGDFVEVIGTVDYDGAWFISNSLTNSFDIVNQTFHDGTPLAFTVTKTGTSEKGDSDLSGLTGVTGVTTNSEATYKEYVVGAKLVVSGVMNQLTSERLTMNRTNGSFAKEIDVNGGVWKLGREETFNGTTRNAPTHPITFSNSATTGSSSSDASIYVHGAGGLLDWRGVRIIASAPFFIDGGGKLLWRDVELDRSALADPPNTSDTQFRPNGSATIDVIGFKLIRGRTFYSGANINTNFSGFSPIFCDRGIGFRDTDSSGSVTATNGTINYTAGLIELEDFSPLGNTGDVGSWNGGYIRFINSAEGSDLNIRGWLFEHTGADGYNEILSDLKITVTDDAGTALEDVKTYYSDNFTGFSSPWNASKVYNETSDVLGEISLQVFLGWAEVVNGNTPTVLKRSVTQTDDIYTFPLIEYTKLITAVNNIDLKGIGEKGVGAPMFDDTLITEVYATAIAYTTLDDAYELYDRAKSYLYDNYAGEESVIVSRSGNQIELGAINLVVNATAGSAFAFATNTITVKSSTFTGGATATTGDVTLQNGALLNGGTFDCDVNIDNNSEADTYTNANIDKLIHTGTGTRTLTLDGGTITELEVTGGANLTVFLAGGAVVTTETETSGTITLSQDITITDSALIDGTRVQLWNTTKSAELDNSIVSGGGGYSLTINLAGASIDDGDVIRIRATYQSGVTAKLSAEASGIVSTTGLSFLLTQEDDTIYNTIGLDGSTITKFTADYLNDEVDIVTASDFLGTELYARFVYFETTEDGIRNFFGGFMAVDIANYENDVTVLDLYINNNTATNLKQTDNVRLYKSNGVYPVRNPTTGGGGVDVVWRSQVYVAETGVSLTAQQTRDAMKLAPSAGLGATDSIDEKLDSLEAQIPNVASIQNGLAKTTELFDHTTDEVITNSASRTASKADVSLLALDSTVAKESTLDSAETKIDLVKGKTDQLNFTGSDVQSIASNAPSEAPTVQQVVDGVWDEVIDNANHNTAKSAGKRLRQAGTSLAVEGMIDDPSPTTSSFITDLTQTESSFYADQTCIFVSGDLEGQARIITSYNSGTKVLTFDEPWTIAPSDTDEFEIKADHVHPVSQIQSGLALESTSTAIKAKTDLLNFTGSDVQSVASNMRGTDGANTVAPDNAGISAIPTNPVLTNDARLDNLDATISSRSSFDNTTDEVITDTASRSASKADVSLLAIESTVAKEATVNALNDISVAEIEASNVFQKTDFIPPS